MRKAFIIPATDRSFKFCFHNNNDYNGGGCGGDDDGDDDDSSFLCVFVKQLQTAILNLIFVVPCIILYNCEINPTRCNNCVLFFAMALL